MPALSPAQLAELRRKLLMKEIVKTAQAKVAATIYDRAAETLTLLQEIGDYFAEKTGSVALYGPIKTQGRAVQKVIADYGGDWYDLKDAVRMTLIAPDAASLKEVQALIIKDCVGSNGLALPKQQEMTLDKSPCGFTGMNFVVTLPNGQPGEIQANIPEVLYGQMVETLCKEVLSPARFSELKVKFNIDGGIGHALYEIYRVAKEMPDGKRAAEVSKVYYNLLRTGPNFNVVTQLKKDVEAFKKSHPHVFSH